MEYRSIKRVISIVITDYVLAPNANVYHDQFFLYSELTKTKFSDIVEIDTLELPKIPAERYDDKLWQWAKFLSGKTMEDFEMLTQENPAVNKAVGVLMELNASQRRRMIAESREKARRDYQARFDGAFDKGVKQGEARGEARGETRGENKKARELLALIEKGYSAEQLRGILTQQETNRL
jgi:predicted transposase/invertase (TIGR01784 family)